MLDPFCGCLTTLVASNGLNRHWIGIDIEEQATPLLTARLAPSTFVHRTNCPVRTDQKRLVFDEPKTRLAIKGKLLVRLHECAGCGMTDPCNLEVDHIVPKSRGGQDVFENFQLLCGNCNRIKGSRAMEYLRAKILRREERLRDTITFGGNKGCHAWMRI